MVRYRLLERIVFYGYIYSVKKFIELILFTEILLEEDRLIIKLLDFFYFSGS